MGFIHVMADWTRYVLPKPRAMEYESWKSWNLKQTASYSPPLEIHKAH